MLSQRENYWSVTRCHLQMLTLCSWDQQSYPGGWFNIKMPSYQYRKSHCGDKTILRPSYLHNGISYTGKMTSLYWIRAQGATWVTIEDDHILHIMKGKQFLSASVIRLVLIRRTGGCVCVLADQRWLEVIGYHSKTSRQMPQTNSWSSSMPLHFGTRASNWNHPHWS